MASSLRHRRRNTDQSSLSDQSLQYQISQKTQLSQETIKYLNQKLPVEQKEYEEEEFNQLASLKLGNEYIIPSNKKLFQFSYLKINNKVINNEKEATEILLNLLSSKLETEANEAKKIYEEKIKLLDEIKKIKSSLK